MPFKGCSPCEVHIWLACRMGRGKREMMKREEDGEGDEEGKGDEEGRGR